MARSMVPFAVIAVGLFAQETALASPVSLTRGSKRHRVGSVVGIAADGMTESMTEMLAEALPQKSSNLMRAGPGLMRSEAGRKADESSSSIPTVVGSLENIFNGSIESPSSAGNTTEEKQEKSEAVGASEEAVAASQIADNATAERTTEDNSSSPTLAAVFEHAHETHHRSIESNEPVHGGAASLLEVNQGHTQFPSIPGLNAQDVLHKSMDLVMGTTGIVPEDYPFACICNEMGVCERDAMQTSCKMRPGTGSGAPKPAMLSAAIKVVALLTTAATSFAFSSA